jgi:hypothetical protein
MKREICSKKIIAKNYQGRIFRNSMKKKAAASNKEQMLR